MRLLSSQYINEVVSLTVMLLMIAALIGGQGAAQAGAAAAAEPVPEQVIVSVDFSFRHEGE